MRSETERSEQPKEGLGRLDDVTEYLLSLTQKHFNMLFHNIVTLRRTRYKEQQSGHQTCPGHKTTMRKSRVLS